MKNVIKYLWFKIQLFIGIKQFQKTGITSKEAYYAFRQIFIFTGGKSNDRLSKKISKINPKNQVLGFEVGVLGFETEVSLRAKVNEMHENGFVIFDSKLTEDIVNKLTDIALTTPSRYIDLKSSDYSEKRVLFDPQNPLSPRYQFDVGDFINNEQVQDLVFDKSLLNFAQEYLGSRPILDLIAFWWSAPFSGQGKSAAAQMYHFDMDRIKFIKFFFYLTDVTPESGPHCYVKGSHKTLPKSLRRDGRFADQEIEHIYGVDNLVEICGKKGTILAVDTRGFHKGKDLTDSNRLLLQIEFSNSMFGQSYPKIDIAYIKNSHRDLADHNKNTYGEIFN